MECVKNIRLGLEEGQACKKGIFTKIITKITRHKVIATIVVATIGFMVVDMMLIASFVSILGEI